MKILSPAGNMESLKLAVFNGADEIYLGINDFNARNNIDGFNMDNLKEAVDFAHIFDIKVCLAINILFTNEEIQKALDIIVDAYNLGVDAFIVQDIGLASLICENYPEIELHASTQMGIHNLEGVKAIEKLGFKRVVLARETPLAEIKRIRENSNIEIEYFAHGALCVSFSGNCYLSSYLCNASGNRGKCKQLCRLPFLLEHNGKTLKSGYLLSAKDFNMVNNLANLQNAGVDVLKIEGRARRPFYVASSTKEYYNVLHGKPVNENNLKLAFNRDYTVGYFNGNGNIISNYNNHIGIFVGTVNKFVGGKNFNEVFFTSNTKLSPKSIFKVFSNNVEKTTLTAYDLKEISPGIYRLTTTQTLSCGDKIHLIVDAQKEQEALTFSKRKSVKINLFIKENQNIKAQILLCGKNIEVEGDICDKAQKQPLNENDLINNFNKNEFFEAKLNIVCLENVFMPKQKLNEFRRRVFNEIFNQITSSHQKQLQKTKISTKYNAIKFQNFQVIENINENFVSDNIIYSPEKYNLEDIQNFKAKCLQLNKTAFLDTPNFALKDDIILLNNIIQKTNVNIVANNYYALSLSNNPVIGAGLNVYNNLSAKYYNAPVICAESEISSKIKTPYMTLRHCPLKSHINANCNNCPYSNGYTFKMESGKPLKLKRKKLSSCTFYLTD